jgi:hypothetical protein
MSVGQESSQNVATKDYNEGEEVKIDEETGIPMIRVRKENADNVCHICGKKYAEKRNVLKHIATVHEGLKEYVCSTCGKCFGQVSMCHKTFFLRHFEKYAR